MTTWFYFKDELRQVWLRFAYWIRILSFERIQLVKGWRYIQGETMHDYSHVWPERDLIEHQINDDGECPCNPPCQPLVREDGSIGWHYDHRALDGRIRGQ